MRLYPALKAAIILSLGVLIGYWIHIGPLIYLSISLLTLLCSFLLHRYALGQIMLVISLLSGGAASIIAFHGVSEFAPSNVKISGIINDIPHHSDQYTSFPLDDVVFTLENGTRIKCHRLLWISVKSRMNSLTEGTFINLSGILNSFEPQRNPSDFNYKRWRINNNFLGSVSVKRKQDIEITGHSNSPIISIRSKILQKIDLFTGNDASLVRALILGIRRDIDPILKKTLQETGLAHLLALSGLHIGFVVIVFGGIAIALNISIPYRYVFIICGIVVYAIILPPRPSTLRAVIMAASFLAGPILKKWSPPLNSLGFAALLILAIRPGDIFDVGFQLSFAAVAGLIMFAPQITNINRVVRDINISSLRKLFRIVANPLLVSTSATLMLYPLLSVHFGIIPLLTVVFNLVAIPLTGLMFLNSWAVIFTSLFWDGLATPFGHSLSFIIFLWKSFASIASQNNVVSTIHFAPITVIALLSITIWLATRKARFAQSLVLYTLGTLVILVWQGNFRLNDKIKIWFVDVGQGDGTIIILPDNKFIAIDAGNERSTAVLDMLNYLDCNKIDLLIASHSDADHIGGLIEIIQKYEIQTAINSARNSQTNTYRRLMDVSRSKNISWNAVYTGDRIGSLSNTYSLTILSPPTNADLWSTNNSSVTMRLAIVMGNLDSLSILMTGDIELIAENRIIADSLFIQSDLLKVSHHGSATSTSQSFLNAVKPEIAVISRGDWYVVRNEKSLKNVTNRLRTSGIIYYITSETGAILFTSGYDNSGAKWQRLDWRNPTIYQWLFAKYR